MEEKLKNAKFHCKHTVDIEQFKNRVFQSLDTYSQAKKQPIRKKWTTSIILLSLVILPSTVGFAYTELSHIYKWNNSTINIQNTGSTKYQTAANKTTTTSLYSEFESGKADTILSDGTRVPRKLADLAESRKAATFPIHDANTISDWKRIDGYGMYGISISKNADGKETASNSDAFLAGYASLFKNSKGEWVSVSQTSTENNYNFTATFRGSDATRLDGFGDDLAVILTNPANKNRLTIFQKQNNQLNCITFDSYADSLTIIAFAHEFLHTSTL